MNIIEASTNLFERTPRHVAMAFNKVRNAAEPVMQKHVRGLTQHGKSFGKMGEIQTFAGSKGWVFKGALYYAGTDEPDIKVPAFHVSVEPSTGPSGSDLRVNIGKNGSLAKKSFDLKAADAAAQFLSSMVIKHIKRVSV